MEPISDIIFTWLVATTWRCMATTFTRTYVHTRDTCLYTLVAVVRTYIHSRHRNQPVVHHPKLIVLWSQSFHDFNIAKPLLVLSWYIVWSVTISTHLDATVRLQLPVLSLPSLCIVSLVHMFIVDKVLWSTFQYSSHLLCIYVMCVCVCFFHFFDQKGLIFFFVAFGR